MRFGKLTEAAFVERLNRFLCRVQVEGREAEAFLPNSGRMEELLVPGSTVYLSWENRAGRKTDFDVKLADSGGELVLLDSRLPNRLVEEGVVEGVIEDFVDLEVVEREPSLDEVRLDLLLGDGEEVYVEVKSCTLVREGVGLFPDAPTQRGRRHLRELRQLVEEGKRAAVVFAIGRGDASTFVPNRETDPEFADELARAEGAEVDVLVYGCDVMLRGARLDGKVTVELSSEIPDRMP